MARGIGVMLPGDRASGWEADAFISQDAHDK